MAAMAIFTCRQNSHPFQERHISLHEPLKIGRSVARSRPAENNVIFDCKVLSRNHALLWYENEKFYLQDTKSSNGTFVNNQRLSKGSEESRPKEIWSGDTIQFGVDVLENSRKVTHGCIVACITLFYPDGQEAKNLSQSDNGTTSINSKNLYKLSQYLQEALHREQMLEQKLSGLQRLIGSTQKASESGWQALIDEDRLLSRIECLENQLHTCAKGQTEESLRQELISSYEDKSNYEMTAKESLRQVLEEKLEAIRKVADLERSFSNTEEECAHLKELCEMSENELHLLTDKHNARVKEMVELQEKLEEAEKLHKDEIDRVETEKDTLLGKIEEMKKEEDSLLVQVEALQADNDFSREQLAAIKSRIESNKESASERIVLKDDGNQIISAVKTDAENNREQSVILELKDKLKETQEKIGDYEKQLKDAHERLKDSEERIVVLQSQLEQAQFEVVQNITKVASLEEKIRLSDMHLNQVIENTTADLKLQLHESQKQTNIGSGLTDQLQDRVDGLEAELHEFKNKTDTVTNVNGSTETLHSTCTPDSDISDIDTLKAPLNQTDAHKELQEHYEQEIERFKELLEEARHLHTKSNEEVVLYKDELDSAQMQIRMANDELDSLKDMLEQSQTYSKEQEDEVATLQEQLKKAEATTHEVKEKILPLRDQILAEQENTKVTQEENIKIQNQLHVAEESAKVSKDQADKLRDELEHLEKELNHIKADNETEVKSTQEELEKQYSKNQAEFCSLKEECSNLKQRIQAIEIEMQTTRKENAQLQTEYTRLQESYSQLEALKERLETNQSTWKVNVTDAQKEAELTKGELLDAKTEVARLKDQCTEYTEEMGALKEDFSEMSEEYMVLSDKSRMLCICSSVPLFALLLAILLAFYPTLAQITATHQ